MYTKKVFFISLIVAVACSISNGMYAQVRYNENKYIKFTIESDKSIKCFFKKHSIAYSLSIFYKHNIPTSSLLQFKGIDGYRHPKSLYFDLEYEADSIFFDQVYNVNNMALRKIELSDFESKEMSKKGLYSVVIFEDSVVFRFIKDIYFWANKKNRILGWPASYQGGDVEDLEKAISQRYRKEEQNKVRMDSIYVFKCQVLRNDSLGDIEQIVGETSSFSEIVVQEFRKNSRSWRAAILETSGLRHSTFIRVFVRLNRDGSVTIKTPKELHTIAGY